MQLLTDWRLFPPALRGTVLSIGNFDGVHLGHAQMLSAGRDQAAARRRPFTIMTFDPHPTLLLKPHLPRWPLTTLQQRLDLLAAFSPDILLVLPTTPQFLAISADDFLHTIVRGTPPTATTPGSGLVASLLVEGPSFTYGQGAKGTVDTLQQHGPALGIDTLIVPTQQTALTDLTLINVSSTVIRWLISHGRVADAARALGRPYSLTGTVVPGAQRGRTIGFPTANIQAPQLIPAPGVYAGMATIDAISHPAAISIGTNPTFESPGTGAQTTVEAFLLDYSGDLYGKTLHLSFHHWIREMATFAGAGPLVTQMHRDVAWTRKFLAAHPVTPVPAPRVPLASTR